MTISGRVASTLAGALAAVVSVSAAAQDSMVLEEVVVTAEKANRSLQDTSTSVAVFSENDLLQNPGLESTLDLVSRVANITQAGKSGKLPSVRGVDGTGPAQAANAFIGGTRSRFAYQIDGKPLGFNETTYGSSALWDVQQIEVLRGPQSTLQGRNAIAGTIAIKTKDPTFDWEGGLRVIGGDYSARQGSFFVSGPILEDQLAFRVAYDHSEFDSFVNVRDLYPGIDDPQLYKSDTARAKLLIRPKALEGFSTLVTVTHADFRAPQSEIVEYPFSEHQMFLGYMPTFQPKSTSAVFATTWELNDALTFENTLAYTDFDVRRFSFPGDGNATVEGHDVVVEPRLRLKAADGRLNALFGVYYYRATQDEFLDLIGGMTFDDATTNQAAFTELEYKLTNRLDLTVGGRYERERRDRVGGNFFFVDLDETYNTFLPKAGLAFHMNERVTFGAVVGKSYNGGGAAFTFEPPFVNYSYTPEYVWNTELYWRANLAASRLFLTGNVFYSDYEDYQLDFDINPAPEIYTFVVRNAKQVETYGSELGLKWLAMPGFTVSADLGLLKTKIAEYPGNSVEGNELPRAPQLSAQLGFAYAHPSGLDVAVNSRYSDRYYDNVINRSTERSDAYWIANAQVGYTFSKFRVFGIVENLFDEEAILGLTRGAVVQDDLAFISRPRTWKAGFSVNF